MIIDDHINMLATTLIGPNLASWTHFDMSEPYSKELIARVHDMLLGRN